MSSSDQKQRRRTIVYFCILALISAIMVMSTYQITRREKIEQTIVADTILFSKRNESAPCSNEMVTVLGDGFCDDEANTEVCLYDLGDCCDYTDYLTSRSLCTQCFCQADIPTLTSQVDCWTLQIKGNWSWLGNGECNSELNNVDNWFDAGDCCYEHPIKDCYQSNAFCHPDTLGDGICQDYNNGPLCDYDLGDCCQIPFKNRGDECCYCVCQIQDNNPDLWDYYGLAG